MAFNATVTVVFNYTTRLSEKAEELAEAAVIKAALDIEAQAKRVVPVDTGTLKSSIVAEPQSDLVWIVAPHTDYAIYVEYGTSHQRAQPYMRPAAERVGPVFIEAMKQIVKM